MEAGALLVGVLFTLHAGVVIGGAPGSFERQACKRDLDCPDCSRCEDGFCPFVQSQKATCGCDEDCRGDGLSCVLLSRSKPLCGGVCSPAAPKHPQVCGSGIDRVRLEAHEGGIRQVPDAAFVSRQVASVTEVGADARRGSQTPYGPGQPLSPTNSPCEATCGRLELVGPMVELRPLQGTGAEAAVVTYGGGHWYVAWGGRPENATQLQRLTSEGKPDGPALRIEGTTPRSLLWSEYAGGELVLQGWVPPAYGPAGYVRSIHRFQPNLELAGTAVRMSEPGVGLFAEGRATELAADGALSDVRLLGRRNTLVRELQIPRDASPGLSLKVRDWRRPQAFRGTSLVRVGSRRFVVDHEHDGVLTARELKPGGKFGPGAHVFSLPEGEEGFHSIMLEEVDGAFWIAAQSIRSGHVHVGRTDGVTSKPNVAPLTLVTPGFGLYGLRNGHGTPLLIGSLASSDGPSRIDVVPIDSRGGAACHPWRIQLPGLEAQYQGLGGAHFVGDTAGVLLSTYAPKIEGEKHLFFTRMRCARAKSSTP